MEINPLLKRVAIVGVTSALILTGFGAGVAFSQTETPTREEALAALDHAQADLNTARAYINAQTPPTTTPPPTTTTPVPSPITVTATKVADNKAKIDWTTNRTDITAWTVGRDGTDTNNTGPWTSGDLAANTRTFTFDLLRADFEYTFTVTPKPTGDPATVKLRLGSTTPTTPPGTTTPTTPPPAGTGDTAAAVNNWGAPAWEYNFDNLNGWGLYNDPGNQHGVRKPSQCVAVNGVLELRSLPDRSTCGMADNLHKNIEYGRWETRVKSEGAGWMSLHIIWPSSNAWPRDGERDWREHRAGANCYTGFIHYPNHDPQRQWQLPENTVSCVDTKQWHNVAYEVTPTRMRGWVDGKLWYDKACDADLCQMPGGGHLTIQNDDQGSGGGNTATTFVDWVRYYPIS